MHSARFLDPCLGLRHVLDFEAEVMNAGPLERTFCLRGFVVFELEDSEIYMPVGQVAALRGRGVDFTHFFQAETLNIELLSPVQIPRGDCDVPNSCHSYLLLLRSVSARAKKRLPESITFFRAESIR